LQIHLDLTAKIINLYQRFRHSKGPPFRRVRYSEFWKPSFMVVAGNSSWYCHN